LNGSAVTSLKNWSETTMVSPAVTGMSIGMVWFSSTKRYSFSPPSCRRGASSSSRSEPGTGKVPPE
jgi:hypothetical protein